MIDPKIPVSKLLLPFPAQPPDFQRNTLVKNRTNRKNLIGLFITRVRWANSPCQLGLNSVTGFSVVGVTTKHSKLSRPLGALGRLLALLLSAGTPVIPGPHG